MELFASHILPGSQGGGPADCVATFLFDPAVNFGPALSQIRVTIFNDFRDPSLKRFPLTLPTAPSCRFLRKQGNLTITWLGKQDASSLSFGLTDLTREEFLFHLDELHDAVAWAFSTKLSDSDSFDRSACLSWISSARGAIPDTDEELRATIRQRMRLRVARLRKTQLDKSVVVDWNRFDPDSAYTIHEPFYWLEDDPAAPHGSQIGAAVLARFHQYESLPADDAFQLMGVPDWSPDATVENRRAGIQAWIAIAIAHIKFRARCPKDIANRTLSVIELERQMPDSPWARRYKGIPVSALDHYLNILRPFLDDRR